ncbi:hypothetical protein N7463_010697, partial [Penicillium fimorum]
HGFPIVSISWRRQIPLFLDLGFRVICPDCIGYGRSIRSLFYVFLVSHLFTVCVPHHGITTEWAELETVVQKMPSLAYQLQFVSGAVEEYATNRERTKQVLTALFHGQSPTGEYGTSLEGLKFDVLPSLKRSDVIEEEELEFYTDQFTQSGFTGGLNYYRSNRQNFEDDQTLLKDRSGDSKIYCPTLFIWPSFDIIITKEMAQAMALFVPDFTLREISGGTHWVMWERPTEVNQILKEWISERSYMSSRITCIEPFLAQCISSEKIPSQVVAIKLKMGFSEANDNCWRIDVLPGTISAEQ